MDELLTTVVRILTGKKSCSTVAKLFFYNSMLGCSFFFAAWGKKEGHLVVSASVLLLLLYYCGRSDENALLY